MSKTASLQFNLFGLKHLLDDMSADISSADYIGVLGQCQIGLFTNWAGFSPDIALADLTEAAYTGYARQAVVWSSPYENTNNEAAMSSGDQVFRPTDSAAPETVIGAMLIDDLGNLVGVGSFDQAIPMESDQDQASIIVEMALSTVVDMGRAVAID